MFGTGENPFLHQPVGGGGACGRCTTVPSEFELVFSGAAWCSCLKLIPNLDGYNSLTPSTIEDFQTSAITLNGETDRAARCLWRKVVAHVATVTLWQGNDCTGNTGSTYLAWAYQIEITSPTTMRVSVSLVVTASGGNPEQHIATAFEAEIDLAYKDCLIEESADNEIDECPSAPNTTVVAYGGSVTVTTTT
jgi:hypothetical protein